MVTVRTYPKPYPGHKLSLPSWILIIYHSIVSWPLLRDISPRSRSLFTHGNFFFRPYLFMGPLDRDYTSHNCCPWPRGCCCVRTCLVGIDQKTKMAAPASDWLGHFRLLWNSWTEFNETWQKVRSKRPLPSLCFRSDLKTKMTVPRYVAL